MFAYKSLYNIAVLFDMNKIPLENQDSRDICSQTYVVAFCWHSNVSQAYEEL